MKNPPHDVIANILRQSYFQDMDFEKVTEVHVDAEIFTIDTLKSGRFRLIYSLKFAEAIERTQRALDE